ncbi:MAG: exonuclease domain-containing protein [Lachnospiraceae bacterium]|jgi:inhibitor of KinA sporulation pathway (predicted exonuclease)|nr:exonuclease domain-containing protein [Lachnospiraceae bacterium]MDE6902139.1 exonuclease domain-containing protein [Lachnospiraceae bacterium]
MNYIVLDLEWNQSSDGKEEESKLLPFEIVEIGAIRLNSERQMVSEFSELIKPQVYHEMHHITRKLIHLQMDQLEHGRPFAEVAEQFFDWCGEAPVFCTWGAMDLTELQRNLSYYGMQTLADGPFPFLDVQKLFSIGFEDRKSRRSLEYAIDYLKIEKDIPFHRAFSDAYYTAKVLALLDQEVLRNYSYDVFHIPKDKQSEIHVQFDTYAKYISRGFADKAQAMEDRTVSSTKCYLCRRSLRRKIRWFTPNGKHYYCVSYCDRHGYMKSKVRMRKSEDKMVYVVKTEKFITEAEVEAIRDKQKKSKDYKKIINVKKPGR